MSGYSFARLGRERRIVHEFEVVKIGQVAIVLGGELRLWQAKGYSNTLQQLQGEGVEFLLNRLDHRAMIAQNRW